MVLERDVLGEFHRRAARYRMKATAVRLEQQRETYRPRKADSANRTSLRAKCGWVPRRREFGADIVEYDDGAIGLGGLFRCHSLCECPLCATTAAHRRADLLRELIRRYEYDGGGLVYMLTATMRHSYGDDLRELREALVKLWRRTHSTGKQAGKMHERLGLEGTVRAMEVSWGMNGWHPHLHVLLFCRTPMSRAELTDAEDWYFERWRRFSPKFGIAEPLRERAIQITKCHQVDYVTKMLRVGWSLADELTRGASKGHKNGNRDPWSFLAGAADGDEADAARWNRWCTGIRGARWLVVSKHMLRRWHIERPRKAQASRIIACLSADELERIGLERIPQALMAAQLRKGELLAELCGVPA